MDIYEPKMKLLLEKISFELYIVTKDKTFYLLKFVSFITITMFMSN
jgi:hypothetical protein